MEYRYFVHDTFVYRTPMYEEAFNLPAMQQMEIWDGHAWMRVTATQDQLTVVTFGGPLTAEEATARTAA